MVLAILVAGCVLAFTSFVGLTVACSRSSSCVHRIAATLYFTTALPVAVALAFVITYCLVFRPEAQSMVSMYWNCLETVAPNDLVSTTDVAPVRDMWIAAKAVYESITLTAAMLATSEVLLLVGLYNASSIIGWGVVAANLMLVVNGGAAIVGLGLSGVAGGLVARGGLASSSPSTLDYAMLGCGLSLLLVSLLGVASSRCQSRCLLQLYTTLMATVELAMVSVVGVLVYIGPNGLASTLGANWSHVQAIYPLSQKDVNEVLSHHWYKLLIAGGLIAVVMFLVLVAACVLRRTLVLQPTEKVDASETAGLLRNDGDDDLEM